MVANIGELEKRLWDAADELRANSKLKSSEYSMPVLGLIFLKYADFKFAAVEQELEGKSTGRRSIGKADYQAKGVLYVPPKARFSYLQSLPEGAKVAEAINEAMDLIMAENEALKGVLPKTYARLDNSLLISLLKNLGAIPMMAEGDTFGKIYEYFLSKFAMSEGQKGGEFFTPTSLVKLIVGVMEPFHGRIFDPACGSGGMFVQSAEFVRDHHENPNRNIVLYGQEKTAETVRLCKMNLAVHGLDGDIRQSNSYYEDPHHAGGRFDFVMANPPFNVDKVDKERLKDDTTRFPFGMPKADNANYLWIQMFYSALSEKGRAGFVMPNSASDARGSEQEIRRELIKTGCIDVMVSVPSNFFYTVTLPCMLWFMDKTKTSTARKDKVLFIDARHIYRQIDRAHRDFTDEQIEFLSNIARLYRGEPVELIRGSGPTLDKFFPDGRYIDVPGLCYAASLDEIAVQGWSLTPGRYVGMAHKAADEYVFQERLEELNEELEGLNLESHELEREIASRISEILDGAVQ